MVAFELSRSLLIGLGFGVFGISVWIIGLLVFNWLLERSEQAQPSAEDRR